MVAGKNEWIDYFATQSGLCLCPSESVQTWFRQICYRLIKYQLVDVLNTYLNLSDLSVLHKMLITSLFYFPALAN